MVLDATKCYYFDSQSPQPCVLSCANRSSRSREDTTQYDGAELADHLIRHWGYQKSHQTGSHIHLRTDLPTGQTTIVPAHRPLKTGTLNGILNHVARHKRGPGREYPQPLTPRITIAIHNTAPLRSRPRLSTALVRLLRKDRAPRNLLLIRRNPVLRSLSSAHRHVVQLLLIALEVLDRVVARRLNRLMRRSSRLSCPNPVPMP